MNLEPVEPQALIVQTKPRIPTYLVGPRRALRRLTTPVMVRVVVGLTQMTILGLAVLLVVGVMAGFLVSLSAALLTIALNMLGAIVAILCGCSIVRIAMNHWRSR